MSDTRIGSGMSRPVHLRRCNLWKNDPALFPGSPETGLRDRPTATGRKSRALAGRRSAAANMLPLRAAVVLLLSLIVSTCTGEGGDCSCDISNSRCDEFGVCRCDPGWDGERCNRCVPMPGCVHGSCDQPWQCVCTSGWAGRFCDKDLSVCSRLQPCHNGATCVMEDRGDFTCLCPEGFHGPTCQRRAGPCYLNRSACKNGGQCEDADGFASELMCRCLAGFTGRRCEVDVDDCAMKPCANGATCLDGVNRFSCVCPAGFSGRFCSVNLDDCASRPCLNAARCLDGAGGFRCVCRPGFSGAACETPWRSRESRTTLDWDGGGTRSAATTSGGGNSSRHHGDRLLKVTVSERGGHGPSEPQLIVLLVLAAATLGAVALTATLVLQGHCRNCGHAPRWSSLTSSWRSRRRAQERHISFLNAAELEKKKLNVV